MRILIPKKSLKSLRSEDRLLLIQRLKDDIELLRPHINAEMQYAIKYKGTTKNLIDRANELLQLLNEELEKP